MFGAAPSTWLLGRERLAACHEDSSGVRSSAVAMAVTVLMDSEMSIEGEELLWEAASFMLVGEAMACREYVCRERLPFAGGD